MTANEITAALLIEIPRRWPDHVRVWRANRVKAMVVGKKGRKRMLDAGVDGQADITGIAHGGRRLEIEVKAGNDILSEEQKAFCRVITFMGGIYIVARDVENTLKTLTGILELSQKGSQMREGMKFGWER